MGALYSVGAVHAMLSLVTPVVEVTAVGAAGSVVGIPVALAEEEEFPAALVATTLTTYVVPASREVMLQVSTTPTTQVRVVCPDDTAVAVYPLMAAPPFHKGATQLTTSWLVPVAAVTAVGASGTVRGVPDTAGEDAGPVPATLEAVTVIV